MDCEGEAVLGSELELVPEEGEVLAQEQEALVLGDLVRTPTANLESRRTRGMEPAREGWGDQVRGIAAEDRADPRFAVIGTADMTALVYGRSRRTSSLFPIP